MLARVGAALRVGPALRRATAPWHATRSLSRRGGRLAAAPLIRELRSVEALLEAHRAHRSAYREGALGASWSALSKLVRRDRVGQRLLEGPSLEPLVEHTLRTLPTMGARYVANTAHGVAATERATRWRGSDALWNALTVRATSMARGGDFNAQDLAITAWAYATAGHASPALFDALALASIARVGEFKQQNLANTAWAYATAGHASPALFDAIASASVARMGEFDAQGLANTAWAYATAGHASPALFDAIASASAARVGEFNAQALANTAWAYAAGDGRAASLFASPTFADRCAHLADEMTIGGLCQLHQWQLWLELECACDGWPGLRPDVRERCRRAFVAAAAKPSLTQRHVAATLADLGLGVTEEVRTAEGYSIDVVVGTSDGREVAIEVDGPSHFVGASHMPTGATMLKRRQLRAAGWVLLPVPYWEWMALEAVGSRHRCKEAVRLRRREYLAGALLGAGVELVDPR